MNHPGFPPHGPEAAGALPTVMRRLLDLAG